MPQLVPETAIGDATYDGGFVAGPSGGAHYVTTQADDSLDNEHLLSAMIGRGLIANRPAAGIAGRLYYSTDANILERDSGSTWETVEGVAASQLDRSSILITGVGYKFWAFDPANITSNQQLVNSQAHYILCPIPIGTVITTLHCFVKTAGSGLTLGKMGLYSKGGAQLAVTGNSTASFEAVGRTAINLQSPYTTLTSDVFYVAMLTVGALAVHPVVFRGFSDVLSPFGEAGSGVKRAVVQNGLADLPTNISLSTNDTQSIWMGGS